MLLWSEAVVRCCSAEKVFLQIRQNWQENTKEILAQILSCEFCEISHNIFFKEPFVLLLHHKHWFCLLSHHDLSSFQKQCHTYFLAEYFFDLICRLGTGVSSRRLEDVLKTSWKRLEDVLKMSWRRFCKTYWRRLKDVLKMSGRRMTKTIILIFIKTSSRRLESVFWRRMN